MSREPDAEPHIVPPQEEGFSKDFSEERVYTDIETAEVAFLEAKTRLLRPGTWHDAAGALSARFSLHDAGGKPLSRDLRTGDVLRISIPGPGHAADGEDGDEDDWVRVEAVVYDDFPDEDREAFALTLRPTASPGAPSVVPAHFFSSGATSTLAAERRGKAVTARYFGRNEKPNTDGRSLADAVRNIAVGIGGLLGFSNLQWKALLAGLLPEEDG